MTRSADPDDAICPRGCTRPKPVEIDGVLYCTMCLAQGRRMVCEPATLDDHPEDDRHG